MSTFTARYPGICTACGDWFEAGAMVRFNEDDQIAHAACSAPRPRKPAEVCANCFLEKPCPCEDGL